MSGFVRSSQSYTRFNHQPPVPTRLTAVFHHASDRTYRTSALNGTKWHDLAWSYGFRLRFTLNNRRMRHLTLKSILRHRAIDQPSEVASFDFPGLAVVSSFDPRISDFP